MTILSKKLKNDPNATQPSPKTKESQDDSVIQTLGITIAVINTTKDLVPIDLVKGILGTIGNILSIVQSVIKNKSDFLAIANKCDTIRRVLTRAIDGATDDVLQGSLGDALSELNVSINHIYSEVASKKEHEWWRRSVSVTIDRNQISGWERDLDRILVLFNTEAITGMAIGMKKLALGLSANANASINVSKNRPTMLPSRPSMIYGRDDLIAELTNLVLNEENIALIGPGGMGKSSLAKAIINESFITEKFGDRRFFVTYDGLDASTMTFETFMSRLAEALGIVLAGSDPMRQISTFLRSASALLVFDNAETFEEASGSPGLEKIPPAIAEIANTPGMTLILTSRSRRNAPDVAWITKDVPPLDPNSAQAVFFRIYGGASRSDAEEEIKGLLEALEFHPLSISILANAAQQNSWSPAILLKRWNDQHSKLLDRGKGKLQSLSFTMQLSLSSPTIQDLGEDGLRALAVIAFLPQGLNDDLASDLLPSIPQIDTIVDVLCTQSLVYRQGGFVKMLAPIRHHVRDSLATPDPVCLGDIRVFYHLVVGQCTNQGGNHADIIITDHLNIEHIVAFDLSNVPDGTNNACNVCYCFIWCLSNHLPRPTILNTLIFDILENSSTWTSKAHCLFYLGVLYCSLSRLTEGAAAFQAAEVLYLSVGDHEQMAHCVIKRGENYNCQGRFIHSQQVLEDLQHSDPWELLSNSKKAKVWYFLDIARMYTFNASAGEPFAKPMDDRTLDLPCEIVHCRAKLHHWGDIAQVKMRLEDLLLQPTMKNDTDALLALAEVASRECRLSECMDILQKIVEILEGNPRSNFLWFTGWKAVLASKEGNYDLARQLIHKSPEQLEFLTLPSTLAFLQRTYNAGYIELAAGEYQRAEILLTSAIEGCDMQDNLTFKALSVRGLGEIAFTQGNHNLAAQRFAETHSLCTEMGLLPRNLYTCMPFSALPERFIGWALFLEGQSPFANRVM